MEKAEHLRKILGEGKIVRIVGAHDGMGAKLVEQAGFDGVWASGCEIATSYALPDASILSMPDFLHRAKIINDATNLPVIADCDTGYGNAMNAMHMAREYESAGIAGVCIEDKKFPKTNSLLEGGRQELASIEEFALKVRACKDVQRTGDFMVFARVEALIAGWGMEEASKRAHAYADAGADGIFIHSKAKTPGEVLEFVKKWDGNAPILLCPTKYPSLTFDDIKKTGKVRIVIYANQGMRAQIKATKEVLSKIHVCGTTAPIEDDIATMDEIFALQGMKEFKDNEKGYIM